MILKMQKTEIRLLLLPGKRYQSWVLMKMVEKEKLWRRDMLLQGGEITTMLDEDLAAAEAGGVNDEDQEDAGGVDYMLVFVEDDYDYFREWRL